MTPELLDAWLRMLSLMNKPDEIIALAPVYEREILFRVLQGPLGWMLRDIATPDTYLARIHKAINWLKKNYMHSVRVEELAENGCDECFCIPPTFPFGNGVKPGAVSKKNAPDAGTAQTFLFR